MASSTRVCQVNTGATIAGPGSDTDGFGVKRKRNIYIIAASDTFTANSVACNPGDESVSFNPPFLVTGAVSSATVGTIWYYIE